MFLRRARLHYMERAAKAQQEMMIDHGQNPPKDIPNYIFTMMAICPYIACACSICLHIAVTLVYSMKFQRIAERYWYYSTIIGLGIVLVILELMRSAVMTIVELRKFEIRRRLAGGDFNRSRIRKQTAESQDPLHPKRDKKKPNVPTVPPKKPAMSRPPPPPKEMKLGPPPPELDEAKLSHAASMSRPGFLPAEGAAPKIGDGNMPFLRTASGAGLPVMAGQPPPPGKPPPGFNLGKPPPGIPPLQGMPGMQGTGTPGRGGLGQVGGSSLLPGKLRTPGHTPIGMATPPGGPGTPTMGQSFGSTMGRTPGPPPPPPMPPGKGGMPPSPSGSVASHMSRSLSEKMAANRGGAPPPPPGARGATPPGSHRSGGGGAKPPQGPPPTGHGVEKSRSAKRGQ